MPRADTTTHLTAKLQRPRIDFASTKTRTPSLAAFLPPPPTLHPQRTSCFCLFLAPHSPSCFSCCSVASIRLKIAAALSSPSPFRFYNANVETLLESNNMGGAGFSGISANFYPWLHARLCSSDASQHDKAKIQRFLSVAEVCAMMCFIFPRLIRCRLLSATGIQNRPKRKAARLHISAFALLFDADVEHH